MTPATVRMATTGNRSRTASKPMASSRRTASPLFDSGQPPALSMRRASERLSCPTLLARKKLAITAIPSSDASVAASRENGTLPFSTASRIFFSVASSVLLSLSGPSDMHQPC